MATTIQKITPNLWFDKQAEEAVNLYTSIFKDSKIGKVTRYGKAGYEIHGMPEGTVLTIEFSLDGQEFVALNGGPAFQFNEAISFIINCETQEEVDYYWQKLTEGGGQEQPCGWLKDKFGVSWQVVPTAINELISDPERSERVMNALFQMKKIDIKTLEEA